MRRSDRALGVYDRHSVLHDTDVGAWEKYWLPFGGCAMSLSRCVSSDVDCPFDCPYKEVEHEKDLSPLCAILMGSRYPKLVVIWVSTNASIDGGVPANFTFVCIVTCGEYFLTGITSSCPQAVRRIGRVIRLRLRARGES